MNPLMRGTPGISHKTQAAKALDKGSIPINLKILTTETETKAAQAQQINKLNFLN